MTVFSYQAKRSNGEEVSGQISASSRDMAYADLRRQGLRPDILNPLPKGLQAKSPHGRVPLAAQLSWIERMSTMVGAGLPVDRALSLTMSVKGADPMRAVAAAILEDVRSGETLSNAMSRTRVFRPSVTGVLTASERTGDLNSALEQVRTLLAKSIELRRTVAMALVYPALLVFVAIGSVILMLGFVVPQFSSLIGASVDTPPLARIVLGASDWMRSNAVELVASAGIIIAIGYFASRRGWIGAGLEHTALALPAVGPILRQLTIATLFRNLGTFLKAGIPMLESLSLAAGTVQSGKFADSMSHARDYVAGGGRLSAYLESTGHYPSETLDVLRAGEESAAVDRMLLTLADSLESNAQSAIKRLLTLLEPALILLIGILVGGIVFAIFQAILSVNDVVV